MAQVDGVAEGKRNKLNWILVKPAAGGRFLCGQTLVNLFDRFVVFRPDLYAHEVTTIERGTRWLLTFALNRR